ncbi:MAG: hypothetical protein E7337_04445 [Clostridiales bacterium]|nr:hypothetical protein [Clostridiales bacterium]
MMGIWQKIKSGIQRFMMGRHGADELSFALLIFGLIASIFSSITGAALLSILGMAAYIWSMVRIFSRNNEKRYAENQKYLNLSKNFASNTKQFFVRLKNSKQYKYFKCPECHCRLRLPRKVGEVTVTCGKCKHSFKQKA